MAVPSVPWLYLQLFTLLSFVSSLLDSDPFNFSVVYASLGEISFHCKDIIFCALHITLNQRCFIMISLYLCFFDQWIRQLNAPLEEIDPEIADIIELEKARQWKVIIFDYSRWRVLKGGSFILIWFSGIWAYTVRELHLCLGYGSCGLCYD